jgi:steroid delta-isomerase-like uncharacterized protein
MSTEAQNKALIQRYVRDISNQQNLAAVDELVALEYLHHSDSGVSFALRGPALVRSHAEALNAAFAHQRWTIEDLIAEGNKVVYRWRVTAVHQGEYLGMAATGKAVSVIGISIMRIEQGKIAERWGSADLLGLMEQLQGSATSAPESSA